MMAVFLTIEDVISDHIDHNTMDKRDKEEFIEEEAVEESSEAEVVNLEAVDSLVENLEEEAVSLEEEENSEVEEEISEDIDHNLMRIEEVEKISKKILNTIEVVPLVMREEEVIDKVDLMITSEVVAVVISIFIEEIDVEDLEVEEEMISVNQEMTSTTTEELETS